MESVHTELATSYCNEIGLDLWQRCFEYALIFRLLKVTFEDVCTGWISKPRRETLVLDFMLECPCILYRVSQEECARLREGVPYVKVYRNNPKHLCPKLNGYGDNGQGKVWSSGGSTHCTCQLTTLSMLRR